MERDGVFKSFVGNCSRAWGVFEDEAVFVLCFFYEGDGFLEVIVGFARESDDEIAGEGDAGDDLSSFGEQVEVLGGGVAAVHCL